jgi:hypothetical protein
MLLTCVKIWPIISSSWFGSGHVNPHGYAVQGDIKMKNAYVKPEFKKQGSIEDLTKAVMDLGAGDANWTIMHNGEQVGGDTVS